MATTTQSRKSCDSALAIHAGLLHQHGSWSRERAKHNLNPRAEGIPADSAAVESSSEALPASENVRIAGVVRPIRLNPPAMETILPPF